MSSTPRSRPRARRPHPAWRRPSSAAPVSDDRRPTATPTDDAARRRQGHHAGARRPRRAPYAAPTRTPSPDWSAAGRRSVAEQQTWFANLTQLPVRRLGYRLDPGAWSARGTPTPSTAEVTLQLEGYDDAPVDQRAPGCVSGRPRTDPGRFAADRGPRQTRAAAVGPRPGRGARGVPACWACSTPGSLDAAPVLLDSVEAGIASVSAEVPYDWTRSVVVYALSDPEFLLGLEDVPGRRPGRPRRGRRSRSADEHPRRAQPADARPAPGTSGTGWSATSSPTSRSASATTPYRCGCREGLAEYVAVRPLAPEDRRISEVAVRAAQAGVADLPDDASFNDEDSDAHYGLAWWAVRVRRRRVRRGRPVAAPRRDGGAGRGPRRGAARPVRHQQRGAGRAGGAADSRALRPRGRLPLTVVSRTPPEDTVLA